MSRIALELAAACRALARRPGAALSALLSLTLTIGATALVATWYETFVGDPLPGVPRGSAIVVASPAAPDGTVRGMPTVTWEEAREWRTRLRTFESLGVWSYVRPALRRTAAETPRRCGDSSSTPATSPSLASSRGSDASSPSPTSSR